VAVAVREEPYIAMIDHPIRGLQDAREDEGMDEDGLVEPVVRLSEEL
jgi:hypothetical protein